MASEHGRFTDRARQVFALAEEEARALGHKRRGTEHLLLGLLREGDGLAAQMLASSGVGLEDARSTVVFILERGEGSPSGALAWSPRAAKVIDLSLEEARSLNHAYAGTEHVLLGILREAESSPANQGKGIAAGVLQTLGVRLSAVRDDLLRAMGIDASEPDH